MTEFIHSFRKVEVKSEGDTEFETGTEEEVGNTSNRKVRALTFGEFRMKHEIRETNVKRKFEAAFETEYQRRDEKEILRVKEVGGERESDMYVKTETGRDSADVEREIESELERGIKSEMKRGGREIKTEDENVNENEVVETIVEGNLKPLIGKMTETKYQRQDEKEILRVKEVGGERESDMYVKTETEEDVADMEREIESELERGIKSEIKRERRKIKTEDENDNENEVVETMVEGNLKPLIGKMTETEYQKRDEKEILRVKEVGGERESDMYVKTETEEDVADMEREIESELERGIKSEIKRERRKIKTEDENNNENEVVETMVEGNLKPLIGKMTETEYQRRDEKEILRVKEVGGERESDMYVKTETEKDVADVEREIDSELERGIKSEIKREGREIKTEDENENENEVVETMVDGNLKPLIGKMTETENERGGNEKERENEITVKVEREVEMEKLTEDEREAIKGLRKAMRLFNREIVSRIIKENKERQREYRRNIEREMRRKTEPEEERVSRAIREIERKMEIRTRAETELRRVFETVSREHRGHSANSNETVNIEGRDETQTQFKKGIEMMMLVFEREFALKFKKEKEDELRMKLERELQMGLAKISCYVEKEIETAVKTVIRKVEKECISVIIQVEKELGTDSNNKDERELEKGIGTQLNRENNDTDAELEGDVGSDTGIEIVIIETDEEEIGEKSEIVERENIFEKEAEVESEHISETEVKNESEQNNENNKQAGTQLETDFKENLLEVIVEEELQTIVEKENVEHEGVQIDDAVAEKDNETNVEKQFENNLERDIEAKLEGKSEICVGTGNEKNEGDIQMDVEKGTNDETEIERIEVETDVPMEVDGDEYRIDSRIEVEVEQESGSGTYEIKFQNEVLENVDRDRENDTEIENNIENEIDFHMDLERKSDNKMEGKIEDHIEFHKKLERGNLEQDSEIEVPIRVEEENSMNEREVEKNSKNNSERETENTINEGGFRIGVEKEIEDHIENQLESKKLQREVEASGSSVEAENDEIDVRIEIEEDIQKDSEMKRVVLMEIERKDDYDNENEVKSAIGQVEEQNKLEKVFEAKQNSKSGVGGKMDVMNYSEKVETELETKIHLEDTDDERDVQMEVEQVGDKKENEVEGKIEKVDSGTELEIEGERRKDKKVEKGVKRKIEAGVDERIIKKNRQKIEPVIKFEDDDPSVAAEYDQEFEEEYLAWYHEKIREGFLTIPSMMELHMDLRALAHSLDMMVKYQVPSWQNVHEGVVVIDSDDD